MSYDKSLNPSFAQFEEDTDESSEETEEKSSMGTSQTVSVSSSPSKDEQKAEEMSLSDRSGSVGMTKGKGKGTPRQPRKKVVVTVASAASPRSLSRTKSGGHSSKSSKKGTKGGGGSVEKKENSRLKSKLEPIPTTLPDGTPHPKWIQCFWECISVADPSVSRHFAHYPFLPLCNKQLCQISLANTIGLVGERPDTEHV